MLGFALRSSAKTRYLFAKKKYQCLSVSSLSERKLSGLRKNPETSGSFSKKCKHGVIWALFRRLTLSHRKTGTVFGKLLRFERGLSRLLKRGCGHASVAASWIIDRSTQGRRSCQLLEGLLVVAFTLTGRDFESPIAAVGW